jgi:SAM-dependent methyltransferase
VLDAGCGLGEHSIRVAREGYTLYGIDISSAALAEAQRRAESAGVADRVCFEHGDVTNLAIPDGSFSRVFSWGVVIHIREAEKALAELVRVLRPGGRLALYVTNAAALDYPLLAMARAVLGRSGPAIKHYPLGYGCWYGPEGNGLWVWRIDIRALTRQIERLGLVQTHRIAGSLTELHVRLRGAARKLLLHLNNTWYRWPGLAGPCVTNLLVFEKPAR